MILARQGGRTEGIRARCVQSWLGLLLLVVGIAAATPSAAKAQRDEVPAPRFPDPVPLRILSPVHLLFYHLSPTPATTLGEGSVQVRVDLSESNVLHPEPELPFTFRSQIDGEVSRLGIAWERGMGEEWDLGVEVPVYYAWGGFLDEVITETERAFRTLKPRRRDEEDAARQNEFGYRLFVGDRTMIQAGRTSIELGDVAVFAKRRIRDQHGRHPTLALRGGIKLPTGNSHRGFGSGGVDMVAGTAASWELGPWTAHAGGQLMLPVRDFRNFAGLTALPQFSLYVDGAYSRWPRLALQAQVAFVTPAFETDHDKVGPRLGPRRRPPGGDNSFEGHVLQITPALSWRLSDDRTFVLGIVEDFGSSEDTAFDVTLLISFQWRLR